MGKKKKKRPWIAVIAAIVAYAGGVFTPDKVFHQTPQSDYWETTLPVSERSWEVKWSAALAEQIGGQSEYKLPDGARVDVLTDEFAVEVDWLPKWHQGVGQALHYAFLTGRKPVLAIGLREKDFDEEKLAMARAVARTHGISLWILRAN